MARLEYIDDGTPGLVILASNRATLLQAVPEYEAVIMARTSGVEPDEAVWFGLAPDGEIFCGRTHQRGDEAFSKSS